jgi:hypothetical protein
MNAQHLPIDAPLERYREQAAALLAGHRVGHPMALQILRCHLPRFLDPDVTWKPRDVSDAEVAATALDMADAELAVARGYSFLDWAALENHVTESLDPASAVHRFEHAAEAVITGDIAKLDALLGADPDLVRARSTRVTCFDPPVHRATLVHYLGANGVEGYRQRSPRNAVEVARRLLEAGAEVDALASMYGGECTTLSMLVSSTPPAEAGVQTSLVHTLLDFGAAVDGAGAGKWVAPLQTALVFGFEAAAQVLVERGARVETLTLAAGLGRVAQVRERLARADADDRHSALALAAQLGHAEVVALLLDAGEDPDRNNPEGFHAHATPLHHAALGGHLDAVRALVERGARLDLCDTLWNSTPLGWAKHGGQRAVATYLEARGAF